MPNWDDIRYFLALADAGSLAGAGRALGCKHTTIARRVTQLEDELGVTLVTRSSDGVQLTQAGERAVAQARAAATAIDALERAVRGADDALDGTVHVAISPGFAGYLASRLAPLKRRHPALNVHLHANNRAADLTRGEADLAVRFGPTADQELTVRKLGVAAWAIYAARGYLDGNCLPGTIEALRDQPIIGFDDELARVPGAGWIREHDLTDNVVMRTNNIGSALNATLSGLGVAPLPCLMAGQEPELVRLLEPFGGPELTLVAHPDVLRSARVRAVWDFLVTTVQADRPLISGTS